MKEVGSPIKFNYAATSLMYYVTSKRLFLLKNHIEKKINKKKRQNACTLIQDDSIKDADFAIYRCERRRAIFQTMSFHYYYSTTSTLNQDQTWTDACPTHHFPGKLHREWTYHGNVLYGENFKELLQNLSLT